MTQLILTIFWVVGAVLAKGFWSTFFAVILPFWAWYLVAERLVLKFLT